MTAESFQSESNKTDFEPFLDEYCENLDALFSERADLNEINLSRGMPPYILREVRANSPLSVFVPEEYGGRGIEISHGLAVLAETSYFSLPLSLLMGINGGLFLQPLAKYGEDSLKRKVFTEYLGEKKMGGLMITEPDFGTDALKMETSFRQDGDGDYRIEGTKHWAGLTGWADYWLVAARESNDNGSLGRDISLFVCDGEEDITVEERFENLGLAMLPYGRNKVHATVPGDHKLEPESSGIRMMQDLLHRSRFQFPGMGMGFLQRLLEEAREHCQSREVGGKKLYEYDQVQHRLSNIQAACTACSAMCVHTAENAGQDQNLHGKTVQANSIKAIVTDLMQEASQSFLQLSGAKGYRKDHFAGRALVDSRPFQIFEGSNDVLYDQVARSVLKSIKRSQDTNLSDFLSEFELTSEALPHVPDLFDFELTESLPQRQMVGLGKSISKLVSMNFVEELGERGFPDSLVENCLSSFKNWLSDGIMPEGQASFVDSTPASTEPSYWLRYV